jgi:hypothetical protein
LEAGIRDQLQQSRLRLTTKLYGVAGAPGQQAFEYLGK